MDSHSDAVGARLRVFGLLAAAGALLLALASCGGNSTQATQPNASSAPAGSSSATLPAGPIAAAGVEVLQPVEDAGRVPLNTPVERQWTLRNTGASVVKVGRPSIQVLEGC